MMSKDYYDHSYLLLLLRSHYVFAPSGGLTGVQDGPSTVSSNVLNHAVEIWW
jgi:hypothetical protein